ncbi:tricarballylate dehydrogenase [Alicyclobacillus sacchari]|uniref:Tricarballylate dehydrogenase n=1 Tax=Alicyclobacillus sacchari TaxID=392010 RepID=A0A4R8LKP3_9BACL|nr:FAD-dependent tricarballylate dehydrogenase TcuA [Alicyclobacillus sacchari]TDY43994.1 tricarballylate dehydrogenase [Alicyclobacillus sacchari]
MTTSIACDVLVVGGGNAAMAAALSARDHGASVIVVERAPRFYRGGNSRHTRDFRIMHTRTTEHMLDVYPPEEFLDDLRRVAGGEMDEELARLVVERSEGLPMWLSQQGVRWQEPLSGTLHLARTNLFMLGGGRAMMNAYYRTAEKKGIQIWYEAMVEDIEVTAGVFGGAQIRRGGEVCLVRASAVVFAAGGYEANIDWLRQHWGDAADNFVIRGTRYNQGNVIDLLLAAGATPIGHPRAFHAVAVDGRAPKFDGGIVTRLDSVPFGIVINLDCERFYDEGEDFWPKRYAIWGGLIARQQEQVAYSIIDSKVIDKFMPSVFPPMMAHSIADLAMQLGLDADRVQATVDAYNAAVQPGNFRPDALDDCHTVGIDPPKSHWAQRIDTPPFYAYPLRAGITFTYRGVRIQRDARVQLVGGDAMGNVFAAGEMVAGNVLRRGYLAGFGLTMGAVFGRIAGEGAARVAR